MAKVPVTEAEKRSPLYKYFLRDLAPVPQEKQDMLANNPLTPEAALQAPDLNKLFEPGYLPGEFGWTRFADGTLTLANFTKMPGVTVEMFDWWFAWHGLESLRYKIWDPEDHYYVQTQQPEQGMDPSLSLKERYWNTHHDVIEDTGTGKGYLDIHFRNPADIGFDPEKLKNFDGTIVCAGNEHTPVIMCHFVRPIEGGIELRTRFWMGCCVKDGRPQPFPFPPGVQMPDAAAFTLLAHNAKEFTNLAAILPEVYAEFHDKF